MQVCLPRRRVLLGGLALAVWPPKGAAAAAMPGVPGMLAFDVRRNGHAIGTHTLKFTRAGARLTVAIEARFRIGLGPITLFRYTHRGEEVWHDGQFQSLATETDDNGTPHQVRAQRTAGGIAIRATGQPDVVAPVSALPLTHWAQAAMHAPLFNPETGKLLDETARPCGPGSVTLADGKAISATGYTLAGEAPIKDWYDVNGNWAALDATGKDGSAIAYRRA
jgi:hypothetical protein